jgi:GNAT superfamily N-acetyltransferase
MHQLTYKTFIGQDIVKVIEPLAWLRIQVFRDFPYLYEGNFAYEQSYLKTYAEADRAFLFTVFDQDQLVGATTGIPLIDEASEVIEPFAKAGFDLETVFYFGESILLKEYRGLGIGHRFFDEREAYAYSLPSITTTCFCAVDRGENHPKEPIDYRPNDAFWLKRGYEKQISLQSLFEWPDVGELTSTAKPMIYWLKEKI